ncbi:MAG: Gfo/Idh/MocA family oxidoreductase [Candidatus Humimicrobiaceae bacterium]
MKTINIAMLGTGGMSKYHSYGFKIADHFFDLDIKICLKLLVGRSNDKKHLASKYGFEKYSTNINDAFKDDIDLVDIITPNYSHIPLVKKAAAANKIIFCEKPVGMNYKEALEGYKAVEVSKVLNCVNFNFRKATPVALIKDIIEKKKIGEIYTWKIDFLADDGSDINNPINWFYQKKFSGGGANYDLNVHLIDLAHFLVGDIESIVSLQKTFIKERKDESKKGKVPVDTDDYTSCLANFKNGAAGLFDASRISTGDRLDSSLEIRGSTGAVKWDYQNFNFIELYLSDNSNINGFRKVYTTESGFPYMDGYYGMAGHGHHYDSLIVHQVYDLLRSISKNNMPSPNFKDGLKAQKVLEAINQSHKKKRWIKVEEIK